MANPQKENGYTPVANEILDQIIKCKLNGTQFRILIAIWRHTYGFNRKSHSISESFLSKTINIARPNVSREIKPLFDNKILIKVEAASFSKAAVIMFNKNYEEWQQVSNPITVIENDTITGIELDNTTGIENDTQERNIKDNIKDIYAREYFSNPEINSLFIGFLKLRKKLKAENSDRGITLLLNELNKYADDVKIAMINKSTVNSWKSVFPLKQQELKEIEEKRIQNNNEWEGYAK